MYFAARLVNLLTVRCGKTGLLPKIYFLGLHSPEKRGELQEISRPYSKKSLSRPVFPERRAESSMSDDKAGRTPSPRIIAR